MDARITELLEELKQAINKAATTGDNFQFAGKLSKTKNRN